MVPTGRRARHPMPAFVRRPLAEAGVEAEYAARPPYQRNDYIGWIMEAIQEEPRERRLRQMLEELEMGGVYMKMDHPPSRRS